jgi:hypothetical protein
MRLISEQVSLGGPERVTSVCSRAHGAVASLRRISIPNGTEATATPQSNEENRDGDGAADDAGAEARLIPGEQGVRALRESIPTMSRMTQGRQ